MISDATSGNGNGILKDKIVDLSISMGKPSDHIISVEKNQHYEVDINLPAFKLPSFNLPVSSPSTSQLLESSSSQLESTKMENETKYLRDKSIEQLRDSQMENEAKYLRDISTEELRELYLEKLYHEKQGPHEFYCPNCKVSITTVLVHERPGTPNSVPPHVPETIEPVICTSCFSFIPIGTPFFLSLFIYFFYRKLHSPLSYLVMLLFIFK